MVEGIKVTSRESRRGELRVGFELWETRVA